MDTSSTVPQRNERKKGMRCSTASTKLSTVDHRLPASARRKALPGKAPKDIESVNLVKATVYDSGASVVANLAKHPAKTHGGQLLPRRRKERKPSREYATIKLRTSVHVSETLPPNPPPFSPFFSLER